MVPPPFELRRLFAAVDEERRRRDLSWAALARQIGVSASTLRRFGQADDAEADGVLAVLRWLNVAPETYIRANSVEEVRLHPTGGGVVRVDMELVAEASDDSRRRPRRTRTSIQNLVRVAQRSERSVASLTRLSEV